MTIDQIALGLLAFTCGFLWAKVLVLDRWWLEFLRYLALMLWLGAMMSIGLLKGD